MWKSTILLTLTVICLGGAEDVRLAELDPPEAQQLIDSKDTTLKYAPKIASNVPAVRYIGNEPQHVQEDIYLANQYHGQDGVGGYLYGYSVPDIAKTEKKKAGGDLRGAYNYISGNGQEIKVEYWDDGSGFHQVDNVPKVLPKQIPDLPEVQAAKDEHARLWAQEAERNSKPIQNPYPNAQPGAYAGYGAGVGAGVPNPKPQGQFGGYQGQQGGFGGQQQGFGQQRPQAQGGYQQGQQGQQGQPHGQQVFQGQQSFQGQQKPQGQGQGGYQHGQQGQQSQPHGQQAFQGQQAFAGQQKPQGQGQGGYQHGQQGQQGQHGQQNFQGQQGFQGQQKPQGQGQGGYQLGQQGSQGQHGQQNFQSQQKPQGGYQLGQQGHAQGQQSYQGQQGQGGYQQSFGQQRPQQGSSFGGNKPLGQSFGQAHGQQQGGQQGQQPLQNQGYGQQSQQRPQQGFPQSPANQQSAQFGNTGQQSNFNKPNQGGYGAGHAYAGQQTQRQNQYAKNPQNQQDGEDDGSYNPANDADGQWKDDTNDQPTGPPKGFFYNFDYPVGIIVSKTGSAQQGASLSETYNKNKANFDQQLQGGAAVHGSGSYPSYQVHS